jgi:hypothetical protein
MNSRLPPSLKAPSSSQSQGAQRLRRSTRPMAAEGKPKPIKSGESQDSLSPEAALWGGADMDKSLEMRADEIEARMAEQGASEKTEKEEANKAHAENADEAHSKAEKKGPFSFKLFQKPSSAAPQSKSPLQQKQALQQQGQPAKASTTSQSRSARLESAKVLISGTSAKHEKPPDAFALLKDAREAGSLFVEDSQQEGHTEDQEDPDLREAVEECIRKCFGVTGIHHIGPGQNDVNEAIIVVSTMQGFGQLSLSKVPETVNGFRTLIAIPFELLPLKRVSLLGT